MRWLIILAAVSALGWASPERYKEQEDFQYSRSSSDEGSKSGYYGAQRGNMGGNYERAHNMDGLAQNQMSGLVRQVQGDLGDGDKTRAGSVFSAASSRGTYGSGSFDTSNLQGRNFAEGGTYDNSNLRSSLSQSSLSQHNSADYTNRQTQSYGAYRRTASDAQSQSDSLQSLDNVQSSNQNNYGSSRRSSGYQSQSGYQAQRFYDGENANSHSGYGTIYTRLTPVRIVVTPGGRVALPVAAQTYDAAHGSSIYNRNALDSEVAIASDMNQGSVNRPKYYESSYKYNKKWEKHDTIPTSDSVVGPTENPIPKNSELYEDVDVHTSGSQNNARQTDFHTAHSSSASRGHNTAKSLSSHSGYNTNYNSQQYRGTSSSNSNSNAFSQTGYKSQLDNGYSSDSSNDYTQAQRSSGSRYSGVSADTGSNMQARYNAGSQLDLNSQVEDLNTKPKSYHSSYSYHKSWERQGDPYVIQPASDSHSSQRLSSSTKSQGYATYQPSSQRLCDESCHIRVARSYGTDIQQMEQQSQNLYDNKDLSQQMQGTWKNFEELREIPQRSWDHQIDRQQSLNQWDNLKDLSQQSQSNWDQQNVGQQSQNQWDNLKDLSQQSQSNWDQQNVGQQSHNQWDNLKYLSQQSQSNWDQQNVGQQSQNQWDNLKDLSQQSQSNWEQNVGQQSQNHWDSLTDLSQQSQSSGIHQNVEQQSQSQWDNLKDLSQQSESNTAQQIHNNWNNVGQQSNNNWDKLENLNQQSDVGQQSLDQNTWDKLEDVRQYSQNTDNSEFGQHAQNFLEQQHQDHKYELNYKSQHDIHAQYQHKSEINQNDDENMKQEKKNGNMWDNIQNITDEKKFKPIVHQKPTKSYFDDDNVSLNEKIDTGSHQKESNENTDYSYSRGFVNPFFNKYRKNQLSQYASTYVENSDVFESNNWNSPVNSNNDSRYNNTHNQTPLTSLWSKLDKIETESGLSKHINHTNIILSTNKTERNFTSLDVNHNNTLRISPLWYVEDQTDCSSTSQSTEHTELLSDKQAPKTAQSLAGEIPETPRDIGRGDIGPEDIVDIDESNKLYKNPINALSQDTFDDPEKYGNVKPHVIYSNNSYMGKEHLDDRLRVLGIQQQKDENKIDFSNKNDTSDNILQTNSQHNKHENNNESGNIDILNQNHVLTQTDNDEAQTETKAEPYSPFQNYSTIHQDQEVELQNTGNVNIEQDILFKPGHVDLQIFTQQYENNESQYSHNFQETLQGLKNHNENLEQHNLYNYRQEKVLDAIQKNIEQHTSSQESKLDLENHNKNLNQQNLKHKNSDTNEKFVNDQNIGITQVNLARIEKSIGNIEGESNLRNTQENLFDMQQEDQDQNDRREFMRRPQFEQIYGVDYEANSQSFEQDFEHDFGQQQAIGGILNKFKQGSQTLADVKQDTQQYDTNSTTSTQTTIVNVQHNQGTEKVTEKPGFWKSVGDKISSAKDKVVSWFRS